MEKYYEILDSKYWTIEQPHPWRNLSTPPRINREAGQIFRVIALISLSMLFWRLADQNNDVALNLIGLVLALSAFFAIKLNSVSFR